MLARVLPLTEEQLIDAVRAAVAHRFVVSAADGYRLRHRLVAEVLEHEFLPAEQSALHRRYAEALEAAGSGDYARLAHHWQQAGEPRKALPSVVAAARAAERLYGFAEAHRHWTLALELTGDDAPDRTELLGARRRVGPPLRRAPAGAVPAGGAGRPPGRPRRVRDPPAPGPLPGRRGPVGDRRDGVRAGPRRRRLHPAGEGDRRGVPGRAAAAPGPLRRRRRPGPGGAGAGRPGRRLHRRPGPGQRRAGFQRRLPGGPGRRAGGDPARRRDRRAVRAPGRHRLRLPAPGRAAHRPAQLPGGGRAGGPPGRAETGRSGRRPHLPDPAAGDRGERPVPGRAVGRGGRGAGDGDAAPAVRRGRGGDPAGPVPAVGRLRRHRGGRTATWTRWPPCWPVAAPGTCCRC